MLTVYNCVVNQHDLRLVGLAILVCGLASITAVNLLRHVERAEGNLRTFWLAVSASSIGFGNWSTHFIAMVAFQPSIRSGYAIGPTASSLIVAIMLTGVGMAIATRRASLINYVAGGIVIGLGIACMHFVGMAAFDAQAHLQWDPLLVAVSILLGASISVPAIVIVLRQSMPQSRLAGAALLTLAICSLHFTAMASLSLYPDSAITVAAGLIEPFALALALTVSSIVILSLAGLALWLDVREYRRVRLEGERLRELANAAVEGLLICEGDRMIAANESVVALSGCASGILTGQNLAIIFPELVARRRVLQGGNTIIETHLSHSRGDQVPVEVVSRPINYGGKPHLAVAIRDLRERKKAEADVLHLAHHDTLTGLPNRHTFSRRLDAEILATKH